MRTENFEMILKKYWGYDGFRPGQRDIVRSIVSNKHTIAILATGGGKSICFQVAGLYLGGLTVVISPLISLMQDQVANLNKLGIKAFCYNSTLSEKQKISILNSVYDGSVDFLYLAPESLKNKNIVKVLSEVLISLVVVDEAHCISIWGQEFRPAYQEIPLYLKTMTKNEVRIAAFTGTATNRVQKDIATKLKMRSPKILKNTFQRGNLSILVARNIDDAAMTKIIRKRIKKGGVIVYCATRKRCDDLAAQYKSKGLNAASYHAGLESHVRAQIQSDFIDNKISLICATNAFGMGVDKSNVYTVIHDSISDSIENYFQEIGRAGRDGQKSICITNLHWRGINQRSRMIENNYIPTDLANDFYNYLRSVDKATNQLKIDLTLLLEKISGINKPRLYKLLRLFEDSGILRIVKTDEKVVHAELLKKNIFFLSRHIDLKLQERIFYESRGKLKSLILCLTEDKCRMSSIVDYFGETSNSCGRCDICLPDIDMSDM